MKRIVQLADYHNSNIGDMVAIQRIRAFFQALKSDEQIEWIPWHVQDVTYDLPSKKADMLVIGGGGLIEGGVWNQAGKWKWKLPFDSERINRIDIPIYVMIVGLNFFRGMEKLTKEGEKHLAALINKSKVFTLRDDGSLEALHRIMDGGKAQALPPFSCLGQQENPRKDKIVKGFFNPAINSNKKIMGGRNISVGEVQEIATKFSLPILSHGPKDNIIQGIPFCNRDFSLDTFKLYHDYDYALVMKGHGQLVAYGKNIPNIALATQDKVADFAIKHGFSDYMVDTKHHGWKQRLEEKMYKLVNDKQYLDTWYDLREYAMQRWKSVYYDFYDKMQKEIYG